MKYCTRCGKQVDDMSQTCTECGYIEKQAAPTYQQRYSLQPDSVGKGFAIASMVLGIVSICSAAYGGLITSIVGVILGAMAKKQQKDAGVPSAIATAGVVLSIIALALSLLWVGLIVLLIIYSQQYV